MLKEQPRDEEQHFIQRLNQDHHIVKYIMAGAFVLGFTALIYNFLSTNRLEEEFLKKEAVTLEGKVVAERYVQPILSDHKSAPSKYFFSIDDVTGRRFGIQVINSDHSPLSLEYVDARLEKGTTVKVKAKQVGEFEYKAFANEVYIH